MEKVTAKTIEQQVSEAILQKPVGYVTLRGENFPVNHPSPATLIMVSELCSGLPVMNDNGNVLTEVLGTAKNSAVVGKIIATLILGAKRVNERHIIERVNPKACKRWCWRVFGFRDQVINETKKVAEIDYFSECLLEDFTPSQLNALATKLFFYSEVADFFGLTTSLSAANLLRRTKEVETAFGE